MLAFVLLLLLCFLSGEFYGSTMQQSPILLLYGRTTITTTTTRVPRVVWRPPSTTVFVFPRDKPPSVQVQADFSPESSVPPPPLSERVQTVVPAKSLAERVTSRLSWLEAAERFRPKETPRSMTKEDEAARNHLNALDARIHDERRFLGIMSTGGGIPLLRTDQRRRWQQRSTARERVIEVPTTPFPAKKENEMSKPAFPAALASEKEEAREIVAPATTKTEDEMAKPSFPAALVSEKEEAREIAAPAAAKKEAEMTKPSFPAERSSEKEDAREIVAQATAKKEDEMTKPATVKKEEASAALSSASPNESANVFERAKSAGRSPAAAKKEEAGISSVSPVHRENASVSSTPSMMAKPTARPTIEQVRK